MNKFEVIGPNGKVITYLNSNLATRQKVTDDQLQALRASHVIRQSIFDVARQNSEHPLTLQLLARLFDNLENEQQILWNFGADPNFHRFFDLPGCTCPRLDNEDRLGTTYNVYSADCPIHGDTHEPFL